MVCPVLGLPVAVGAAVEAVPGGGGGLSAVARAQASAAGQRALDAGGDVRAARAGAIAAYRAGARAAARVQEEQQGGRNAALPAPRSRPAEGEAEAEVGQTSGLGRGAHPAAGRRSPTRTAVGRPQFLARRGAATWCPRAGRERTEPASRAPRRAGSSGNGGNGGNGAAYRATVTAPDSPGTATACPTPGTATAPPAHFARTSDPAYSTDPAYTADPADTPAPPPRPPPSGAG